MLWSLGALRAFTNCLALWYFLASEACCYYQLLTAVCPGKPHEVQQIQVQGLAPWLRQHPTLIQAGNEKIRAQTCRKGPGSTGG